jgi:hypothetical protein
MSEKERISLAIEAASTRPDYECHCQGLDPNAVVDEVGTRYGIASRNKLWQLNQQPPAVVGPLDCGAKTAFDYRGIYGSLLNVSCSFAFQP